MMTLVRVVLGAACLGLPALSSAAPIEVRFLEGTTHGFMAIKNLEGEEMGVGELKQVPRGGRLESEMKIEFHDGSLYHERTVFTQEKVFRLRRYNLTYHGPTFPKAVDIEVNADTGAYKVVQREDGKQKVEQGTMDIPDDVYNGMQTTVVKNVAAEGNQEVQSLVFMPKPRLVKVEIRPSGDVSYMVGKREYTAAHHVLHPDLGLLLGTLATLVGKQPPDYHVYTLRGGAPAFAAFEGPLTPDGPTWRMEQLVPVFERNRKARSG